MSKSSIGYGYPENCFKCRLQNFLNCKIVKGCHVVGNRQDWCPLLELPEKKESDSFLMEAVKNDCFDGTDLDTAYFNGKDAGWNACLDEILKTDGMRKE